MSTTHWQSTAGDRWPPDPIPQVNQFIEIGAFDDDGSEAGTIILQISERFKEDRAGRHFDANPLCASDPEVRRWLGSKDYKNAKISWHMCRGWANLCNQPDVQGYTCIHFDEFRIVSQKRALDKKKAWTGKKDGQHDRSVSSASEAEVAVPPEKETPVRQRSLAGGGRSVSERNETEGAKAGASGRKRPADAKGDDAVDDEVGDDAKAAHAVAGRRKATTVPPGDSRGVEVLDHELKLLGIDKGPEGSSMTADGARKPKHDAHTTELLEKLSEMRKRFPSGSARPQPEAASRVSGAGAKGLSGAAKVLADKAGARASAGPAKGGGTAEASDPTVKLAKALQQLIHEPFDSEVSIEQEIAGRDLDSGGSRRMVFRKLAQEQPGLLTLRAMREYRDLMNEIAEGVPDDEWSPIFLRYFLQCFLVQYRGKLDDALYRELRTYSEAIDGLMKGKTLEVMDLLTQQFRATIMAVNEQSWSAARWLQLIPDSRMTEASARDAEMAHSIEGRDLRQRELKRRVEKGEKGDG